MFMFLFLLWVILVIWRALNRAQNALQGWIYALWMRGYALLV